MLLNENKERIDRIYIPNQYSKNMKEKDNDTNLIISDYNRGTFKYLFVNDNYFG